MVLKLHGASMSTCTKTSAVALNEKGVPFEFVPVDFMKGEHKSPEYMKNQPFGQVPYIDDDGFILYESRAIARYISAKYSNQGTKLIPDELHAQAKFEQAASNEVCNWYPSASGLVGEKVFAPMSGRKSNEEAAAEHLTKLNGKLDVYESILSKQKYLGGDELTLADLFHLPYGTLLKTVHPEVFTSRPHFDKWFTSLENRPSWKAVEGGVSSQL